MSNINPFSCSDEEVIDFFENVISENTMPAQWEWLLVRAIKILVKSIKEINEKLEAVDRELETLSME